MYKLKKGRLTNCKTDPFISEGYKSIIDEK